MLLPLEGGVPGKTLRLVVLDLQESEKQSRLQFGFVRGDGGEGGPDSTGGRNGGAGGVLLLLLGGRCRPVRLVQPNAAPVTREAIHVTQKKARAAKEAAQNPTGEDGSAVDGCLNQRCCRGEGRQEGATGQCAAANVKAATVFIATGMMEQEKERRPSHAPRGRQWNLERPHHFFQQGRFRRRRKIDKGSCCVIFE